MESSQKSVSSKRTFVVCSMLFSFFVALPLFLFLLLPLMLTDAQPFDRLRTSDEAIVGDWGSNCCRVSYALLKNGDQMVAVEDSITWGMGTPLRKVVEGPYYEKRKDGNVCRSVWKRASFFESFQKFCRPVEKTLKIDGAFIDGHARMRSHAIETQSLLEKYRAFGLVK